MIREEESSITDQEFFTSSAFHQYLTSQARAATGRYCYGLQALISWDDSDGAALAYTDSYKIYLNAANHVFTIKYRYHFCIIDYFYPELSVPLPAGAEPGRDDRT